MECPYSLLLLSVLFITGEPELHYLFQAKPHQRVTQRYHYSTRLIFEVSSYAPEHSPALFTGKFTVFFVFQVIANSDPEIWFPLQDLQKVPTYVAFMINISGLKLNNFTVGNFAGHLPLFRPKANPDKTFLGDITSECHENLSILSIGSIYAFK